MSDVVNLADARLRGINLPDDDGVAQDILDEQEAWLAQRIGPLTGEIIETFYVGLSDTRGALYLRRYADPEDYEVVDADLDVDPTHTRLIDDNSTVQRTYSALSRLWTGPYVVVTYTPSDLTVVRSVLYDLVALKAEPAGPYESEQIGSYSYRRGKGGGSMTGTRAALASSILPKRSPVLTVWTAPR
jgi:hypothetical protein